MRDDPAFPAGLRELEDPPHLLTVLGELPLRGVAIVGSRRPPQEAAEFAFALAQRIAEPVISGLASGVDSAAHRGALAGGVQTLAYIGSGVAAIFPPENQPLAQEIVRSGGGIASAELPNALVSDRALVRRDGFQAAHARAVVLVCSEAGGGAMHTMRFAKRLQRGRFAIVPKDGAQYFGNRIALSAGATALPWNIEDALRVLHETTSESSNAASI